MADRVSPLASVADPGTFGAPVDQPGVVLSERLPVSLAQVAAWPDTLSRVKVELAALSGEKFADRDVANLGNDVVIMPIGPGRWLVEAEQTNLEANLRARITADLGSVTGLTHGRVVINVRGDKAARVLATGLDLDFHTSAFPVGAVRVTRHHDIGVTIWRPDETQFNLYVFTSFARGFWHWLTHAAAEVGYRVD